jgi:hypothetical protein
MTKFIAERMLQMRPKSYGETGSNLFITLSIQCEEAMSRVSNMQTYLLSLLKESSWPPHTLLWLCFFTVSIFPLSRVDARHHSS